MAGDNTDDLVMESTTDSPEQIAEGLGIELAQEEPIVEDAGQADAADAGDVADEADPVVEPVVAEAAPVTRTARPQRKNANSAAAAARRQAEADKRVLEVENEALRERLRTIVADPGAATRERREERREAAQPTAQVVTVEQIPDTHPDVARAIAAVTALGAKPKQGDFADFDEYEEARDQWLRKRGRLEARVDSVREDVAQRETNALDAANRAAQDTINAFETSVDDAKARHADYDTVLAGAAAQGLTVHRTLGQALMHRTLGAEVLYHLAKNPAELARIQKLPIDGQIIEAGILEGRLAATLGSANRPARRNADGTFVRHTAAPDPQDTVLGDRQSGTHEKPLDDPNMSMAEYNRRRDKQDEQSGRRRPVLVMSR